MKSLDYRLVASYSPLAYCLSMQGKSFRDRVLTAMEELEMSKAELHRKSGVPYHAIDKFLKREGASTSAENAAALAGVLGIKVDDNSTYDELKSIFYQLSEEKQQYALMSLRGLLGGK